MLIPTHYWLPYLIFARCAGLFYHALLILVSSNSTSPQSLLYLQFSILHTTMAPKSEYYGSLRYKNSKEVTFTQVSFQAYFLSLPLQLVLQHPVVWFKEDSSGGWTRFNNKCNNNNLVFDGSKVPGDSRAVLDTVQEVFISCKGEVDGADLPAPPTKPITFTALVKQLETEGLLKATSTTPKPKVIKPDPDSTLGPQHRAEVLLLDLF